MKRQAGFGTIYIVMAVVVAMMAGAFYLYYKDSQATIADLTAKNAAQAIQIEQDVLIKKQFKEDAQRQVIINATTNLQFAQSRKQVDELRAVLKKKNNITGKTRDIGKLAIHRPDTLGKIFTKGTTDAMRCVELASGAEHTADELAAERRSQINAHCTSLANPNYLPH